ncbi:MAG: molybdenum cofactor biosynthesis protein MoaE [Fibrobacterota bacterium]|nr:molybdenum cofactor biosynthesis protein MoaE [Fibrobacterota bacterium]QQS04865.1 MAG: molybdenum cofactor biosynthesis protein MoaE [Fibrobacterota bacterium]
MRFRLSTTDINPQDLSAQLRHASSGGFVSFEGWVRDHHLGRAVEKLFYQAHPVLALQEGDRIVSEALERFGIRNALCVHRVGDLGIGGIAVWIGVASDHRAEAFDACRWIIDEVKATVPIWKREWFADGTVEWVGCERCARAGDAHRTEATTARSHAHENCQH